MDTYDKVVSLLLPQASNWVELGTQARIASEKKDAIEGISLVLLEVVHEVIGLFKEHGQQQLSAFLEMSRLLDLLVRLEWAAWCAQDFASAASSRDMLYRRDSDFRS